MTPLQFIEKTIEKTNVACFICGATLILATQNFSNAKFFVFAPITIITILFTIKQLTHFHNCISFAPEENKGENQ